MNRCFGRPACRRAAMVILALAAFAASARAGSIEAVLFTPGASSIGQFESPFKSYLLSFIASATTSIDLACYNIRDKDVITALNTAHSGGVTVRVVTDGENSPVASSDGSVSLDAGISVVTDGSAAPEMHHKFVVIDAGTSNAKVWTGSANFTSPGLVWQNNNALVIADSDIAGTFRNEFDLLFSSNNFHNSTPASSQTQFTTSDGIDIEVLFAPRDNNASRIADYINGSSASSIYFAAYIFADDDVSNPMIAKAPSDNFGLFEAAQSGDPSYTQKDELAAAGFTVSDDLNPFEMHHKFIVLDKATVLTGSFNFTNSADQENDENLVIIRSSELAERYIGELTRITGTTVGEVSANDPNDTSGVGSGSSSSSSSSSGPPPEHDAVAVTNYPNPFIPRINPTMTIATNPASTVTRLIVYSLDGRTIRTIYPSSSSSTITWDGKNDQNDLVSSGMYIYQLDTASGTFTGRLTLIK